MKERYSLIYQEDVSPEEERVLFEGIVEAASFAKGMSRMKSFAYFIRDSANVIIAGVKGVSLYGCLYIDQLWVSLELRQRGIGSKLMQACEKLGRERQCSFICVQTMDWEALLFYQKLKFEIEFIREGYEKDSKMYFLRKNVS